MRQARKICLGLLLGTLLLGVLAVAPAGAAFGLKDPAVTFTNKDGSIATGAGSHPFAMTTAFTVNTQEELGLVPDEAAKELIAKLPAGFVGNQSVVPRCTSADFLDIDGASLPACPDNTALGTVVLNIGFGGPETFEYPVYNLAPPPGVAAKLGFAALRVPVTVDIGVNPNPPYNLTATSKAISQAIRFYGVSLTVWGDPLSAVHDSERGRCAVYKGELCPAGDAGAKAFLTLPRSCTGPLVTAFEADSWQNPAAWFKTLATSPLGMGGCSKLTLALGVSSQPTTQSAESASGLDFNLDVNDEGLTNPTGTARSDIKKAVVTLPEGMTVNPSAAEGLATCSEADYSRESVASEAGEGCPEASKLGNVEVETPLLEGELLKGSLYLATQNQNPFNSLLAIYMVIKDPGLGILVKLPGRVSPDPKTGQLVTTFGEAPYELPQFPFSHFRFHFSEGARSPLVTPPACGTYTTKAEFTPWSGQAPQATTASFKVTSGPGGGPCPPGGIPPFKPGFEAGSINNNAATYSPFYMRLTRQDGEQDMTKFSSILPPGVVGKIAGLSKCPDASIATAPSRTGRQELASPSCPESSKIGRTMAGAGVGGSLTYVGGSLYLAGPYRGAPLSVVAITPAVAGPFDVGTVVTRIALTLNPTTAEVEADGAASDPIPHILAGIPLKLRDLRVYVDRPNFILNPTSCDPSSVRATLFGDYLDVFNPADDLPVALSSRYQAANCSSLGFKPKLDLRLKGGTKRGAHPAFKATLTYPKGADYANVGKAVVTLPHSAFLEQGHIRTICTRVQFAADKCPKGSIYGKARAITPLLDEPLEGPVYLRSSSHPLPDLVAALHGVVDVDLVGRIDSINASIRGSFENVPDAPVSKFVLEMQGGKKGLLVNSTDLCAGVQKAKAELTGQNGKAYDSRPVLKRSCGAKAKRKQQKQHSRPAR